MLEGEIMNSKEALKQSCDERGVKDIAECLNISPTAIYNQINDPDKNDILNKFVDFVNACGNDIPIQWAAAELNGIFLKNPDIAAQKKKIRQTYLPEALQEFGNVIKEIGEAMEDGKVTIEEAEGIRKEWDKLKVLLETFVLACEFGFLDKNSESK
jgi:regulatory protein CII